MVIFETILESLGNITTVKAIRQEDGSILLQVMREGIQANSVRISMFWMFEAEGASTGIEAIGNSLVEISKLLK